MNKESMKFSMGNVLALLLMCSSVIGVYTALAADGDTTKERITKVEDAQQELTKSVSSIKVDIAILSTNQKHYTRAVENQASAMEKQAKGFEEVIRILKERR